MNTKPVEMSTLTQIIYTSYHCAAVQCKITVTVLVLSEFVSTTDCLGPCLPNEMHFSTRQNSLSNRQCLCPLVQPVRFDNACVHSNDSYDSTTDCLGPCLPNEMHFSTRQNSLSTRQCLCPLVQPVRLDNACQVHLNDSYDSTTDCLGPCLPSERHFYT